jgi:methyl-accepting chemotaxis protein
VKDNSAAARQIAAAVNQQNAGIVQIFTALTDQSQLTDATLKQLQQTSSLATEMKEITERVSRLVRQYRI